MKRVIKVIIIIIAVLAALALLGAAGISAYTGHQVTVTSNQMTETDGSRRIPESYFEEMSFDYGAFTGAYEIEDVTLTSSHDGHSIPADVIYAPGESKGTVVMVHGMGGNRFTVYPVAELFLENGWDVLAYDQRSSGENTAPYTTYGYLEKFDLIDCVEYLKDRRPDGKIGMWGASFGGATVCAALGYEDTAEDISFAVLDCPLGSMEKEIEIFLNENDMGIPVDYMLWCGNIMNKLEMGYSYRDAEAALNISGADVPLLVLNSKADELTPYYMGRDIYDASPCENKTLLTVEDSGHTDIWTDHNSRYKAAVIRLLVSVEG